MRFSAIALLVLLLVSVATSARAQSTPAEPEICRLGVGIEELYDFDYSQDNFGAVLWVWSLCPRGGRGPLDTLVLPTAEPDINLSPVETSEIPGQGFYQYRRIAGTFRHAWDMRRFPFDRNELVIRFDDGSSSADDWTFQPDGTSSFIGPDVLRRLHEWTISPLTVTAGITEETLSYGLPNVKITRTPQLNASFTLSRNQLLPFVKLTFAVYAAAVIAFLSFFRSQDSDSGFAGRLGTLVALLFVIVVNLRVSDDILGTIGRVALVTEVHLVAAALVVTLAIRAVWERRRIEVGRPVAFPHYPAFFATLALYVAANVALIARAAIS